MDNSSFEENIGGIIYFVKHLEIFLPYKIVTFICILMGVVGNILIISSMLIKRELRRNSTCIFILNLAFADLFISLFTNTGTILGIFGGKQFLNKQLRLCEFLASSCIIACATSLATMAFLALNRYICVFYNKQYNRIFSVKNSLIGCFIAWIVGTCVDLPNFLGAGVHHYDEKTFTCLFNRQKVAYTITISVGAIIVPCTLISCLYVRIFWYSFQSRSRVLNQNDAAKNKSSSKSMREAIKIAKGLFASFFTFSAFWVPLAIVYITSSLYDQLPISIHVFTNLAAHVNSAINPILYGFFNPIIREAYQNLIRLITLNRFFNHRKTKLVSSIPIKELTLYKNASKK